MSIVVIGSEPPHRAARSARAHHGDRRGAAQGAARSRSRPNVSEAVVLSTCNRTEVYAVAERFHGAFQDIRDFLCDLAGLAPDDLLRPPLQPARRRGGRPPVLGGRRARVGRDRRARDPRPGPPRVGARQPRRAPRARRSTCSSAMRSKSGKRARTETAIGRSAASVVVRRRRDGCRSGSARSAERKVLVRRRRRGRRGHGRRPGRRGRRRGRRRQPHPGAGRARWPSASAAGPCTLDAWRRCLPEVDVLLDRCRRAAN